MSTREALIEEINKQPEPILVEVQQFLNSLVKETKANSNGWPKGYFEQTAGSFANEPLERPPQLPFEKREDW
jgi:hypothetical protein